MGVDPGKKIANAVMVAFDTETTGLSPWRERVVEFGGLRFTLEKEIDFFNTLLSIDKLMPSESSKVNGITDEMLKGQPSFSEMADTISKAMEGDLIFAHNAMFDVSFLNCEYAGIDKAFPKAPVLDTIGLARKAFPGLSSYRLANLCSVLKIENMDAHRALGDSRVVQAVVLRCLEQLQMENGTLADLMEAAGRVQYFGGHALPVSSRDSVATVLRSAIEQGSKVVLEYQSEKNQVETFTVVPFAVEKLTKALKIHAASETFGEQIFILNRIGSVRHETPPAERGNGGF